MISRQVLESLVEKGIQAPSGDNLQPWKFHLGEDQIDCYLDPTRCSEVFDAGYRAAYLSIGAVIENIGIAASHHHLRVGLRYVPKGELPSLPVATLILKPDPTVTEDPLHRFIEVRVTNRKFYRRKPIPKQIIEVLTQTGTIPGRTRLFLVGSGKPKSHLASLMGAADRIRFESEIIHREFFRTMRFKKEEAERSRDGVDFRSLELGPIERTFFRIVSNWRWQRLVNRVGLGISFNLYAQLQVRTSPLLGLLASVGHSPSDYLEGGRLMQRLLLKITEFGLAVQPMMSIPIFVINLQINEGKHLTPVHRQQLLRIKERLFRLFDLREPQGLLFLFRLGYAPPPICRSLRRAVSEFLIDEPHPN